MVFSSTPFLFIYLPIVLAVYYLVPRRGRNVWLFAVNLVFYGWGEPVYLFLMLFSIALNYAAGLLIVRFRCGAPQRAKRILVADIAANIAMLAFFKYYDLFAETLSLLPFLSVPTLGLSLPIGISFYTFQTMSYPIDVYRGDAEVQRNFISFGTFVALFPQLIAGPIVRYKDIASQLSFRANDLEQFASGVRRFVIGLGKKVLLANNLGLLWDIYAARDAASLTMLGAWMGIASFSLQIYFDFSGYSDMAIGLGRMLGFEFLENFNYPYISKSVTEFWRRWHISLGTWFRDYVYIPLGGNRRG
ncbi:MAG: MBOAT family protein, partial [Oscillospiraceae bacterium]|nr:MBOAT family protein [Oscillospiraceae bacterium]